MAREGQGGRSGEGERGGERKSQSATMVRLLGNWLGEMQVLAKTSVLDQNTRSGVRQLAVCYGCSETNKCAPRTSEGMRGTIIISFYV